ncbi:MAG TPA: HAMP domain-containing sensor histidine kinase [Kofleriaceae bacterium]|nr:HAMP domain-containing sensor histidine kinase [Kofleriaceae bacterium]
MAETDAARELREKKRLLAALVVHDLRSPLTGIQGCLQLLREELETGGGAPSRAMAYLDDAGALVERTLGLVATILDVDELEEGILRVAPVPVRMAELIERTRAGLRVPYEVRGLRLDVACDPDLVVRLDPDLFWRVFENLLDNAARFAPRGGRCVLSVVRDASGLEIAVGNNGPPVPPAERETIFGRFYQVEARRAAARANRGLGLFFCKLAVEAHGGSIRVEERGELGCVFVIRLPGQE